MLNLIIALTLTVADATPPIVASNGLAIAGVARSTRSLIQIDGVATQIIAGNFHPREGDHVIIPSPIRGEYTPESKGPVDSTWTTIQPTSDGTFDFASFKGGYLVLAFAVPSDQIMVLEATGHGMVYANGPRMGDPYATGYQRIPVALKQGSNELIFAAGRGPITARLVAPRRTGPHFDTLDITAPDLVVGNALDAWIGIRVINAAEIATENLAIEVEAQDGTTTRTAISEIVPLGLAKAPARIRSGAFGLEGPARFRVALVRASSAEGDAKGMIDETTIELAVKSPVAMRKETFRSDIDASAQYFAVVPALVSSTPNPTPGIVLTLHGASVEATSQARCYAPRDWAHIVAPTNRRPYGFDWEEWGRIDAMEVLAIARTRFQTDSRRQWLTGHSMGGHGTWQMGAHRSDSFAAIAPSAGWISFFTYSNAPSAATGPTDLVGTILDRSANPSRTLLLKENYATQGVYLLHGDADDNVPVSEAREMRTQLASGSNAFHPDFAYHEQAGAGHWWGDECVDWPPLMDFLRARTLPSPESRNQISFATISPAIHATNGWVTIDAQLTAFQPSRVDLAVDRTAKTIRGSTSNVARLGIQADVDGDESTIVLEIDGVQLSATEPDGGDLLWLDRTLLADGRATPWQLASMPAPELKCAARMGPFKSAFTNRPALVYGTSGTPADTTALLAKARYDNEQFAYRGNATFDIVDDATFLKGASTTFANRNVVVYGNSETNSAWKALLANCPVEVRNGAIDITTADGQHLVISGNDLGALFVRPRPESMSALVGVVAGTGPVGQRLLDRSPYFVAGTGYPDLTILRPSMLEFGAGGVVGASFFSNDWTLSPTDVLSWRISQ